MHDFEFSFGGRISRNGTFMRRAPQFGGVPPIWFRYLFDDNRLILPLGRQVTPEMADLLDVCLAIAMCDRRAPRGFDKNGVPSTLQIRRCIGVSIPVRRLQLWNRPEIR